MSEAKRSEICSAAIRAIQLAGKEGSKLEKFLVNALRKEGYRVDFHKKDLIPTELFIEGYNIPSVGGGLPGNGQIVWSNSAGKFQIYEQSFGGYATWNDIEWTNTNFFTKGGWTISFYPELQIWISFHDYIPYIYFNTFIYIH